MIDNNIKKILFFFFFIIFNKVNSSNYSVIYVHLGDSLPTYIFDSINQTRLFNESASIYVVCDKKNVEKISSGLINKSNIYIVDCEELPITYDHNQFLKTTKFYDLFKFSTERFFYIEQVIKKYNLENVFHMENDVLIYINLEDYLSIFKNHYKSIAATFDNDKRCIPGFLYIKDCSSIQQLNCFICSLCASEIDMYILGKFANQYPEYIDSLPIIPRSYSSYYDLKNLKGEKSSFDKKFSNNFDLFNSVFDGAALGQYLGGIDPISVKYEQPGFNTQPGFINESCIFDPSKFSYEWKMDEKGRKIPFLKFNNMLYKINNLHIHSKDLKKFVSYS